MLRLRPEVRSRRRLPGMSRDGLITVVGNLPEISPGEHLRLKGRWDNHPKHGKQFQAEVCEQILPSSLAGMESYLGSGMIKGIGPKLAKRIVGRFRKDTFEVIEQDPDRLLEVPGIGQDRTARIEVAWEEQKQVKEIMLFLHSHGVSTNLAIKIYKAYGDQALQIVQENPYQLESDIYGVGFKTADRIAQALGLPPDHPSRIEAGIIFALNEMINDGHVFAPRDLLAGRAGELLGFGTALVLKGIERLALAERIHLEEVPFSVSRGRSAREAPRIPVVYLTPLYFAEIGVAKRVGALTSDQSRESSREASAPATSRLSKEQAAAVQMAFNHRVSVLTGGPGTGKTTCLKALIGILNVEGKRFALTSPTGRAAKRLSEATGSPASTIHRLLEFSPPAGFNRNEQHPLPIEFLIIDEASMLDLLLTNHLLKALHPGTHVLFVGDVDQLPSVGAGDVLGDLIKSEIGSVTRLTKIFRQAAGSQIITNAHRINRGQMPIFSRDGGDFFLFPAKDAGQAADWVVEVVSGRIPEKFKFDALQDIQVLSPVYRGPAGVTILNERLQKKLNPAAEGKAERRLFGTTYRVGDKVMQTRNNYDKDIYNGDIGYIRQIERVNQWISVDFEGCEIVYDWSEVDELVLAYAVSVHKAQGSEFPVVVMPVVAQHYMMLQRNLLYTAVTRASKLCVLTGERRAIQIAVRNNKVAHRFTALDWRLGEQQ
jgi:exodeoxyribonuclease V alpha subunit